MLGDKREELAEDLREIARKLYDPDLFVDGCRCDASVNVVCESCVTYDILRKAANEIDRLRRISGYALKLAQDINPGQNAWGDMIRKEMEQQ
jgi:hypothetical protein